MRAGVCQTPILFREQDALALAGHAAAIAASQPLHEAGAGPALFLLPEIFFGGFDYPARLEWAERSASLLSSLHDLCRAEHIALAGTFWEESGGSFFNAMYLLDPDRDAPLRVYAKRHLFPLSEEDDYFTPGDTPPLVLDFHGMRLGFAVCFEMRFPEPFRILSAQDVDLILVSSQWPASRVRHMEMLALARAVENQCYILAVNCCGPSPYGQLGGRSLLAAPTGDTLFRLGAEAGTICTDLPRSLLDKARSRFDSRRSPVYRVAAI